MITKGIFSRTTKRLTQMSRLFSANTFYAKDIEVTLSEDTSKPPLTDKDLIFCTTPSRHMFEVDFENGEWQTPRIRPFEDLRISPFNITLHYALTCFEGMKAYTDDNDQLRLFRPMENMKRFLSSIDRLLLAKFEPEELVKAIEQLVKIDQDFVPSKPGSSLYLRPLAFGTESNLGVKASSSTKLMVVTGPVGPYFQTGVEPIALATYRDYERGTPKSAAAFKLGSNYGPTCQITGKLMKEQGVSQALWIYDDKILEVGMSNIFFLLKNKNTGKPELITPPLDGSVLPGITRKSVIELVEGEGEVPLTERDFTVTELKQAFEEDRVIEIFGVGTAVTVLPIGELSKFNKILTFNSH